MSFRVALSNGLLIGMALAWLVPFIIILRYGSHVVLEPTVAILILEILLFLGIITFAVYNLIRR